MDPSALLPIISAVLGIMLGGLLTHTLSVRRDVAVKRRELILTNLIQALEEMDRASADRPGTDLKQLEHAISRVQLFGDRHMVDLATTIVKEMAGKVGRVNLTPLHLALRDKIRRELKLSELPYGYVGLVIRYPGDEGFEELRGRIKHEVPK